MPRAQDIPSQLNFHKLPMQGKLRMYLQILHNNFLLLRLVNLSEMDLFLQTSIFAGASAIKASAVQK